MVSSLRLLSIIGRPAGNRSLSVSLLPLDDDSGGLGDDRLADAITDGWSSICTCCTRNRLFLTGTAVAVVPAAAIAAAVAVCFFDDVESPAFSSPWFRADLCNVCFSLSGANLAQAVDFQTSSHVRIVSLNLDSIMDFLLRNRISGVPSLVVNIPWSGLAGGRLGPPSSSLLSSSASFASAADGAAGWAFSSAPSGGCRGGC
ncbi:hypothetical protein AGLY_012186 [Aphis glycines]|uniref:Thioredoxin domain-containing protein n=1 Tax=Aphis glycines TaxID=307491 RepID=A0A6G0TAP7_APHGL|nr:hypothetical protein AGLY_012186 [Aphis glycines]